MFLFPQVSQWFELVVFTASMEIYGTAVADKLDRNQGMLRRRYYRQHCTLDFGSYTKDLSAICNDLSSVFILDNSPGAYRAYPGTIYTLLIFGCIGALVLGSVFHVENHISPPPLEIIFFPLPRKKCEMFFHLIFHLGTKDFTIYLPPFACHGKIYPGTDD